MLNTNQHHCILDFFSFVVYISKTSFVDNSSMSTIYIAQYAVVITFDMYANHQYLSVLLLLLLKICLCIDCMHAEMSVVGLSEYKHDLAFLPMVYLLNLFLIVNDNKETSLPDSCLQQRYILNYIKANTLTYTTNCCCPFSLFRQCTRTKLSEN